MKDISRRLSVLVGLTSSIMVLLAGAAIALHHSTVAGGGVKRLIAQRDAVIQSTNAIAFQTLSGTETNIGIPAGDSDLVVARFSGQSQCVGGGAGQRCIARIVAVDGNAAITVLAPDGVAAFDSVAQNDDYLEAHAIERSARLPSGNYRLFVEWRTTNVNTFFRLDEWHFTVEVRE